MAKFLSVFFAAAFLVAGLASCGTTQTFQAVPATVLPQSQSRSTLMASKTVTKRIVVTDKQIHEIIAREGLSALSKYVVQSAPSYTPKTVPGRPGLIQLDDGDFAAEPPSDDLYDRSDSTSNVGDISPMYTSPPCVAPQNGWIGSAPPACVASGSTGGAFRRQYTAPGLSQAEAYVTLPNSSATMPQGNPPLDDDTGYVYFEGFPGVKTSNSESGFQYSATPQHTWYTFYVKGPGGKTIS
jgi:hypothetical protein